MPPLSKEEFMKLAPQEQIALAQPKAAPLSKEEFMKLPPAEQISLASGKSPEAPAEMDPVSKGGMLLRSAVAGHTAGISEPVISGVKAAADSYSSGKPFKQAYEEDVAQRKADLEANPKANLAANITGAVIPSPANVFGKLAKGGSALAKMIGFVGKEATQAAARGVVIGATTAGGSEAARLAAQKPTGFDDRGGLGSIAAAMATGAALGPLGEIAAGKVMRATSPALKKNAPEITAAAESLGTKPTIGQVTDSKFLGGMESSLAQSPHLGAGATKASVKSVYNATHDVAENILSEATQNTGTEIGTSVRKGIIDKIAKDVAPAEAIYQDLETHLHQMPATLTNSSAALQELGQISKVSSEMRGATGTLENDLANVRTVGDLKNFRTALNLQLKSPSLSDVQRMALNRVKTAVNQDRSQSLMAGAEAAGIPHAEASLNAADALYAKAAKTAQESLPIPAKTGPKGAGRALERINDTALPDKTFNVKDVPRLEALKQNFPEQFEQLRQNRIKQILDNVTRKGEVSPAALVREVDKLEPEAKALIFGEGNAHKIDAMKTLINAFPEKMGPSGTPQGLEFVHFIKGLMTGAPVANRLRQDAYQFIGNRAIEGMPSTAERTLYAAPAAIGGGAIERRLQKR